MEIKKNFKGGVVGTLMSNYGLEKFLKKNKIKFLRSKVGDRYVKEKMKKFNFNLEENSLDILFWENLQQLEMVYCCFRSSFSLKKRKKS